MSILTKVFVVLVTILSVILVALIVPFVANTQNFEEKYRDEHAARVAAEKTATLRQSELGAVQAKQSEWVLGLQTQNQNLMTQINTLQQELENTRSELQGARTRNATIEANLTGLTAANQQHAQIVKELQAELNARRDQVLKQQTEMIQLADRNKELDSQLEAVTREVRRIREQLVHMEEQNQGLQSKLNRLAPELVAKVTAGGDEASEPVIPATTIKGQITGLERLEDETFAQVNVGRNDGVVASTKFMVHRGSEFLGTLIITTVDARTSAGRLDLLQAEVAVGDSILTGGY